LSHPHPITFAGREKPVQDEVGWGGAGQNCHPYLKWMTNKN